MLGTTRDRIAGIKEADKSILMRAMQDLCLAFKPGSVHRHFSALPGNVPRALFSAQATQEELTTGPFSLR
jgi:hypothetical protein